tara:strand:- start:1088 stop:2620 length:1533 start_codon:yes stop_codon:yes gene_type:complete
MSGRWLTKKQVKIYMNCRNEGKTQEQSSAKADISERSGRNIEKGRRNDPGIKRRSGRTRKDPLALVWSKDILPMLKYEPSLQPLTLLEHIQLTYGPEAYPDSILRTLQRRVKDWRHQEGPCQEVMFSQKHYAGKQALSDFTEFNDIEVTIKGVVFPHKLYHFRLMFSGWSYVQVIQGGESYAALSEGLQNALWLLGGAPLEHRTDSLSAAFKNLTVDAAKDQTEQYTQLCSNLEMKATRNNKGVSHENGGVESPHGHIKNRIRQAFLLRGSYDFNDVEAYQDWIEEIVNKHNARNAKKIMIELPALQPLPNFKSADFRVYSAKVSTSSTIKVTTSLYTVPSKLIGANLQIHQYHDHLDCYHGSQFIMRLKRVFGEGKKRRAKNIDYRHVIDSLIKKPGAFYNYQHRDALFPTDVYHAIWHIIDKNLLALDASKFMVGLLFLAAKKTCEKALGDQVLLLLNEGEQPCLKALKQQFGLVTKVSIPVIEVTQHALNQYDNLIPQKETLCHDIC